MFIAASPDFHRVYFQSSDQLSDDAPADGGLYVYDVVTGQLRFSNPDNSPASISPPTFGRNGLVRVSDDGSYLYFVSPKVLAPGGVEGARNLYLQHDESPRRLVAILAEGDLEVAVSADANAQAFYPAYTASQLSEDGTKLLFVSEAALGGAQPNGHPQAYLYDAAADSVRCVSCRPGGELSQGDTTLAVSTNDYRVATQQLSRDGRTMIFTTTDRLLPQDSNGVADVYEYRDGELSLVSSGTSRSPSIGIGISGDGVNAYFVTAQSLASSDIDGGLRDIYDARIDGGFRESVTGESCAGSECQGSRSDPPAALAPTSALLAGSGNAAGRRTCAKGRKAVRAKGKVRCVKKRSRSERRQSR